MPKISRPKIAALDDDVSSEEHMEMVRAMSPQERFLYWIKERYLLGKRREAGLPKPWTKDTVLQNYWFTWPYREMDRTTVWFREHIRDPLKRMPSVLMATVIFRWFNYIPTGELLVNQDLLRNWDSDRAIRLLRNQGKIFTGAYMIKAGNGPPGSKLPSVCKAIDPLWKDQNKLIKICLKENTLQAAHAALKQYKHLGGFMSYEIVCDLRYTYLLENATDVDTWCNIGPGALRGLQRLKGLPVDLRGSRAQGGTPKLPRDWQESMQSILALVRKELGPTMPRFEMREVEHSLCEDDKYERALFSQGKMKRKYNGI